MSGTIPPRPGEALPVERLEPYLRARLPGLPHEPLEVSQFSAGASNLTYLLRAGDWEAVLRRPPLGPLPPRAHDVAREARLLSRLSPVFPLAPRPLLLEEHSALLGAAFYLMERKRGVVLDTAFPSGAEVTPERCRWLSERVVDTLAGIHAIDYQATGLTDLGRPEGFLPRQVHGWIERYRQARTDDVPGAEALAARLAANIPESGAAVLIHHDFKLNNLVLEAEDLTEPSGVLDWEMATIGNPLLDLAIFLSYWVEAGDPPEMRALLPAVTPLPGFLSRRELADRYAQHTGRSLDSLPFYQAFATFKLAGILQQIYARWRRGQTRDERFAGFGVRVRFLIELAETQIAGVP